MSTLRLKSSDALVIVDVQNDFLPGGNLAVPSGDKVIPILNQYIDLFVARKFPVYATRDWHPDDHCSFKARGGTWPPHCIAGTSGANFAPDLNLPPNAIIVSKATSPERDAYSGFEQTRLAEDLRSRGIRRLFIGGLATDYCVLNTVRDALAHGFRVRLLRDAIRAINVSAGDEKVAIEEMVERGAQPIRLEDIAK